ncbi:beta-lactamase family protein [Frigoribacterium sp. CFBP 13605]|uniref:serine hydrolase domain-containing protein n=1 Tax=Frigoribacterium sp. CFBP 13605 TaxID=2774034 RepID=UPI00190874A2|nr:serine hydrolase domain-containing protein [Frigoribacterium sp. CFBP 13605]MBD8141996.1 beta-lactamase family protein [Frigoribacterium sp. CFBP 13605]
MITTPTREAPPSRRRHPRLLVRTTRTTRLAAAAAVVALGVTLAGCASGATGATADPAPPAPPQHQPGGHSLTKDDVDTWLDGAVGSALQTTGIPGATVSVVADGKVLTARGYGMADTGTGETDASRVDPERTLFRVGSVSKVVSATAIMQLVEKGDLDLDADVQQYLDFDLDTPKGAVTLRHLLTHTAGFEEVIAGLIGTPGSEKTLREAVSEAPPAQVFTPGTTPAYSNYGATLAGYVAERVSGVPFADLLQQDVFDRAGMTSSSFAQPLPADLDARLAHGYPDDSKPAVATEVVNAAPAGAMSATATDMARFMLAQLGDLPDDQALLQPDTLAEMHRPALDADDLGTLVAGQRMDLAFFDDSTPGLAAFGHDGDTQVFHSAMRMFPEHDTGIFLSMNGSGRSATASLDLRTTVLQGFADRYLRDAATVGSADTADPADAASRGGAGTVDGDASDGPVAADLAGTYLSSRSPVTNPGALLALSGQTTIVPRSDGTVAVTPKPLGMSTGVYEKVGTDLWREVGGDALLATRTTDTEGDATVEAISWGASFTMLRAQPWQAASAVLPSVVLAVVVLLASMIVWPSTALAGVGRRRRDLRAGLSTGSAATAPRRRDRTLLLSRLGQATTLLALVGWAVVAVQAMSFAEVSAVTLRVLQGLQLLGVVAIVPAALVAWRAVRDRRGWAVVTGRVLVLASLVVLAGFAFGFRLIAPSVSF